MQAALVFLVLPALKLTRTVQALFGSLLTFCSMTAAVKKTKSKMVKLKKSQ